MDKKEFKKDARQFEFTVFLNDNIIVQRFFNVNGYNNKSINSLNFTFRSGSPILYLVDVRCI